MKHFNITGNARLSLGIYNTEEDIDYFMQSINEIKHFLK